MPHIILEYSNNLPEPIDFKSLFTNIATQLTTIAGIHPENIKIRAYKAEHFRVGEGRDTDAFVHADIRLFLTGREDCLNALGEAILNQLSLTFHQAAQTFALQLTVFIHGLERKMYFKSINGAPQYGQHT